MGKKTYMNIFVGVGFVFVGLGGIFDFYTNDIVIIDKGAGISGLVFSVFIGVYLLGTYKIEHDFRRALFYKNWVALFLFYYVVVDVTFLCWSKLLYWRMSSPVIDLSLRFSAIPFNDLSLNSAGIPEMILKFIRIIYCSGYITPLFVPAIANALQGKYKQAWTYILSGHFLQIFLITPFYLLVQVNEIWYVLEKMDPLSRVFSNDFDRNFTVAWCFPSMHTSVAMASLLVAWKDENRVFKWTWISYCILIIASTLLLPIHWTLDVIGGIILGYSAVLIANKIMIVLDGFDYSGIIPKYKRDNISHLIVAQVKKSKKLS